MGPVSSGFTEVRALFDKEVNEIIQDFQKTNDMTRLKEVRQNRAGAFISAQGCSGLGVGWQQDLLSQVEACEHLVLSFKSLVVFVRLECTYQNLG